MNVLLSLGSNLGDSESLISEAIKQLSDLGHVTVSRKYRTEPVGVQGPWYLNCVVLLKTTLRPRPLLAKTRDIEDKLGRDRSSHNAPRTMDIDILLHGSVTMFGDELTIPHPRMHVRRFVLQPAAEVAPEMMHPTLRKSVGELLAECSDGRTVLLVE